MWGRRPPARGGAVAVDETAPCQRDAISKLIFCAVPMYRPGTHRADPFMAVVLSLESSFQHDQNGMTRLDMLASSTAANDLNEVIIYRSTGPWAKRWIERGYPTKNFHVKGKSSDWGPHAGLVPYDGTYSKVGFNARKAADGTK